MGTRRFTKPSLGKSGLTQLLPGQGGAFAALSTEVVEGRRFGSLLVTTRNRRQITERDIPLAFPPEHGDATADHPAKGTTSSEFGELCS
jgi:hypothetical protein